MMNTDRREILFLDCAEFNDRYRECFIHKADRSRYARTSMLREFLKLKRMGGLVWEWSSSECENRLSDFQGVFRSVRRPFRQAGRDSLIRRHVSLGPIDQIVDQSSQVERHKEESDT